MNIKKRLKRFFTLTRRPNGGFTLVEMLVVVAILAILGGASVPIYNGYTEHAAKAADSKLVAAINKAFASACLENGFDSKDVDAATISILEQKYKNISTCTMGGVDLVAKVTPYFDKYYAENKESTFSKQGINSLVWNPDNDVFEISESFAPTRVQLSNGHQITISSEDTTAIMNSTFASMDYAGVRQAILNVTKSGEVLAAAIRLGNAVGDYTSKITAPIVSYGLMPADKKTAMEKGLEPSINLGFISYGPSEAEVALATKYTANGLTMVTAKNLASPSTNPEYLLGISLGDNAIGLISNMVGDTGGVNTISAVALQYSIVSAFANGSYSSGATIRYNNRDLSVAGYLAEKTDDPVAVVAEVKKLAAYTTYTQSDQYEKDVNGFVAVLSILGDNIGKTTAPGAIDIDAYYESGIDSQDAMEVLQAVIG